MKKLLLLLLVVPFIGFTQVQIGQDITGEAPDDQCGYGVAVSANGSIVAVGSSRSMSGAGVVRVFENNNNTWTQIGQNIVGESVGDSSGRSISLSADGSIVAIGAHSNSDNGFIAGHVRVYKNINNVWTQIGQDIDGEGSEHQSGWRTFLSADGSVLAVSDNTIETALGNGKGKIYQYDAVNDSWNQMGANFVGLGPGRNGINIVLSGDGSKAFVGNIYNTGDIFFETNGDIRVYEYDTINNAWIQIGQTISLGFPINNNVGSAVNVSFDGSVLATTHILGIGVNSRNAKVYKNINGTWTAYGQEITGVIYSYLSGDGSVLVTSNSFHNSSVGRTRIFKDINGTWTQIGQTIEGENNGDRLGFGVRGVAISTDNSTLIVGVSGGYEYRNIINHAKVYDLTTILSTENFELDNISIYPNPTKNNINIELPAAIELQRITIYDLVGKKLGSTQNTTVNINNYKAGMYILEIETNKGKSTRKIIKG